MGVSVVLAVKNEENNIKRCLESIKWADEIILVDSESSDRTIEIAKRYNPKIHQFRKKSYLIEEKKNFGIKKATEDWVMIVDADEEITAELKDEIINKTKKTGYDAFNVCFQNYAFGRLLKGDLWKDSPVIRLFRKGKAIYKRTQPHELLMVGGKIGKLKGYINHYGYSGTKVFLKKIRRYASQTAPFIAKNNKGGLLHKSRLKINLYSCYIEPIFFSFWVFFIKKMYKDHLIGLWLSMLMGYYLYIERKKVREIKNGMYDL